MKYTTVMVSRVIIGIAETTDIEGYTVTILEPLLPSDDELMLMTNKQANNWIRMNNKRMKSICQFLNNSEN